MTLFKERLKKLRYLKNEDFKEKTKNREFFENPQKNLDNNKKSPYNINQLYMLSRVDERIGFMTPQQPILRKGAKTDKAKALDDDYEKSNKNNNYPLCNRAPCIKAFLISNIYKIYQKKE